MAHCGNCGNFVAEGSFFCGHCGQRILDESSDTQSNINTPPPPPKPKSKSGKAIKIVLIAVAAAVVAAIVILSLWGFCIKNSTTYMIFNSQGEIYAKSGGTSTVNIDYDGYAWGVNYKPSWVSIDEYDDSFTIHCQPNMTGQDREDHITIKSGKIVQALPIGQYGMAQFISLSESSLKCDVDGGSFYIDIDTDGIGPEISCPEFCRVEDRSDDGFVLVVPPNTEYSRSGNLYVTEDNVSASICVAQEGKCKYCNGKGSMTCPSCGGFVGFGYYGISCFLCGGSGSTRCSSCSGSGIR